MSIAGRAVSDPDMPIDIARIVRAGTLTSARSQRGWSGPGIRLGAADDASLGTAPAGRACAFDGRIDNRAELATALALDRQTAADDAALTLAAHARWGDGFADRIIGDWACAIWDGAHRRLTLAVDPMGMRALQYHCAADGILTFATEIRALHADPDIPRDIDDRRVAAWLCLTAGDDHRTFFRDIAAVAPGSIVTWQDGRVATAKWWRPLDAPMLRLASQADYVDAVRACFEEAVACRIADGASTGAHLSGGLDSGSVTAVAARQMAAQGRRLTAFTAVPAHPHPASPGRFTNEWDHAAEVAAMYPNIDHVAVSNDSRPLLDVLDQCSTTADTPQLNVANSVWVDGIDRKAQDRRITVMLTGSMGNMTLSYDGGMLASQLIRGGHWIAATQALVASRRTAGGRWLGIPAAFADALLPVKLAKRLRGMAGQPQLALRDFSMVADEFLNASGLADQMRDETGDLRDRHRGDGRAIRVAVLDRIQVRGAFVTATRRRYGIDMRDPTIDRRLFELCLSIPEAQFQHNGMPRAIVRGAMAGVLPPRVLNEMRRGLQAADWATPFDAAIPGLRAEIARQRASRTLPDWIDLDRMEALLDDWRGPDHAEPHYVEVIALTRALATGRFVRAVEGGNA